MATRAIWKGILKVGAERIPVKLYLAVEDLTVRFNVLEKSTMTRITQHMVNPEQLVLALEDEFRPGDFHDEYRERVMKFLEARAKGLKPKLHIVARKKETSSLADTLAASLKAVRRDKERAVA